MTDHHWCVFRENRDLSLSVICQTCWVKLLIKPTPSIYERYVIDGSVSLPDNVEIESCDLVADKMEQHSFEYIEDADNFLAKMKCRDCGLSAVTIFGGPVVDYSELNNCTDNKAKKSAK